jgi:hypothetical protein
VISCKQDNNLTQNNKDSLIEKPLKISSKIETKKNTRGDNTLIFENGDTLRVVSNFFPLKIIDSFSQQNKNIRGKYFYCFKGGISPKLSKILKRNEAKINTNTAHSIIIKTDTLFFNAKKELNCLTKNDSILIESTVYTFYQNKKKTNLVLINDFIQIN